MAEVYLTFDDTEVQRVFRTYPVASTQRLWTLIQTGAIEMQSEMRQNAPVFDGQLRKSIRYTMSPRKLEARIGPHVDYGAAVEEGSKPHWTSVKEGTPLRKWADTKGINPYIVQRAIATKGTKGQHFAQYTFDSMQHKVRRDITNGFGQFIREVNSGIV